MHEFSTRLYFVVYYHVSSIGCSMQVLVVNWRGESRAVAIGRLKVETRPMIMVEFQGEDN